MIAPLIIAFLAMPPTVPAARAFQIAGQRLSVVHVGDPRHLRLTQAAGATVTVNGAVFEVYPDEPGAAALVLRDAATGKVRDAYVGDHFFLPPPAPQSTDEPDFALPPAGADVTGQGRPDVVVQFWSGGVHCCYTYLVFELGPTPGRIALVDTVATQDSPARFTAGSVGRQPGGASNGSVGRQPGGVGSVGRQPGGVGSVGRQPGGVSITDMTFAYWNASFGASPRPPVVMTWRDGRFRADADRMRRPPPTDAEFAALVDRLKAPEIQPPERWDAALGLIYTGHADLGWHLLDLTEPNPVELRRDLLRQLRKSPHWPVLKAMGAMGAEPAR